MKTRLFTRTVTFLSHHAPAIMVGAGALSVIGGTVMACKSTLRAEQVLDECKIDLLETDPESKKELVATYGRNVIRVTKLYGPSILMIGGGLGIMIFGHRILNKRYIVLAGAYSALNREFKHYRNNIRTDYGVDADIGAKHDMTVEEVTKKEYAFVPKDPDIFIPDRDLGDGAVFWGYAYSPNATDDPSANEKILREIEREANDMFKRQGYLYLQDVYYMLGLSEKHEDDGIGWVYGIGDDYIDFGIYNVRNARASAGYEEVFLLDFNHDGCILPYL